VSLTALGQLRAQTVRSVRAVRVPTGSIRTDGRGDDPGWQAVPWHAGFVQRDPHQGALPSETTRVRIAFDEEALHVYIDALDRHPDRIRGLLTRRDTESPSDWVEVWLDTQNDRRTAYRFAVNARGVQLDSLLSEGGQVQDAAWDAVWQSATSSTTQGWSAELRVPFSQVRHDPHASSWGIQIVRQLSRKNEQSVFSPTPRTALRPLRYLARLTGLDALPPSTQFDLVPYGVLTQERHPRYHELAVRGGGDAHISLGSATSLHLTINPDFAQVTADPSELNLTAFETFLPERRQFFLDGQELFRMPLAFFNWNNETLYYSRRIGARPSRDLGLADDEIRRYPAETTILGAARVVGRTRHGLSYGLLQGVTARERAEVRVNGVESRPLVAPTTSYTVARMRKELQRGASVVGAMVTNVHRQLTPELQDELVENATAGAIDFDVREGDVGVVGMLVGTQLTGSELAIDDVQRSSTHYLQRPDAEHLDYDPERPSLSGWGAELVGGKLGGAPWRASWGGRVRSPGLNPNDLGYMRRADQQHVFVWVQRLQDKPTDWYRFFSVDWGVWLDKTFGPEITGYGTSLGTWWHLPNNMTAQVGAIRTQEALDVSLLRGGPAFLRPGGFSGWWGVFSDNRKPWEVGATGDWAVLDDHALRTNRVSLVGTVRPVPSVMVSLEPSWHRSLDELQFVDNEPPPDIILGRLLRDTVWITARASWAIVLGLTLEVYVMPYVTGGVYRRFYRVVNPRAPRFEERIEPVAYNGDDRFLATEVRSNVVLRYDYCPGCSAYLVWFHEQSENRSDIDRVALDRGVGDLFAAPATDVVMLKLAHYLSL